MLELVINIFSHPGPCVASGAPQGLQFLAPPWPMWRYPTSDGWAECQRRTQSEVQVILLNR